MLPLKTFLKQKVSFWREKFGKKIDILLKILFKKNAGARVRLRWQRLPLFSEN